MNALANYDLSSNNIIVHDNLSYLDNAYIRH